MVGYAEQFWCQHCCFLRIWVFSPKTICLFLYSILEAGYVYSLLQKSVFVFGTLLSIYQQYFQHQLVRSGLTIRQCDLAGICVSRTLNRVTIAVWTNASTGNSVVALFFYFQLSVVSKLPTRKYETKQMGYQHNRV